MVDLGFEGGFGRGESRGVVEGWVLEVVVDVLVVERHRRQMVREQEGRW